MDEIDSVIKMPDGAAKTEAMRRLRAPIQNGVVAAQRVFIGRDRTKSSVLRLSDPMGRPRLVLRVDSLGAPASSSSTTPAASRRVCRSVRNVRHGWAARAALLVLSSLRRAISRPQRYPLIDSTAVALLSGEISGDAAYDHVRVLTSYHRPQGSDTLGVAARYVERIARQFGLQHVRYIELPSLRQPWNPERPISGLSGGSRNASPARSRTASTWPTVVVRPM